MSRSKGQRWIIVTKGYEREMIANLGWYTNSSKEEVLAHAKCNGTEIGEDEDIIVIEEY